MNWNKAGRPRVNKVEEITKVLNEQWSKSEMKIYKDGFAGLAMAVIQQWKADGSPKNELKYMDIWFDVVLARIQIEHSTLELNKLEESNG